jgi:hypothetical protein
MAIGSLGKVVFEASEKKVRTFFDLKRSASARIGTHDLIGKKPILEFVAPGLEQISMNVRLDVSLGLNPANELKTLREMRDKGEIVKFILNGEPVTENYWLIEQISEDHRQIDNKGRLLVADVSITMKEYVKPPEVVKRGS